MVLRFSAPVVVGYDGSPTARAALMVGAGEATRRNRNLLIVRAEADGWNLVHAGEEGRDPLAEAVKLVRPLLPHPRVSLLDRIGPPGAVLCEQGEGAEMLVVGRGAHGRLLTRFAGSVAIHVACHAPCPVIIVGSPASGVPHDGPVVAGVDREHAGEVLEAAFREADLRRVELVVVHTWNSAYWLGPEGFAVVDVEGEAVRDQHLRWLREVIAPFRSKYPAVPVTESPSEGRAATVLTESSDGAGLMVVGTSGRGPVTGMLFGSVGQDLLRHAHCPVLIVRSSEM